MTISNPPPITPNPSVMPLPTLRRAWLERLPEILVLVLGLLISLTAARVAQQREDEQRATVFHRAVETDVQAIQQALDGLVADVQAIAQFYNASDAVGADAFARFARPFLVRHRAIYALEWVPRVRDAERVAFEAQARREGLTEFAIREQVGGALRPADRRPEYFPVYRTEPVASSAKALGFDTGSEPLRRAALEQARDTAQPVATAPVTLVEETADQRSWVVYVPQTRAGVLGDTPAQRRQGLQGFALGVIRLGELMEDVLAHLPPQDLDLVLRDVDLPVEAGWLAVHPSRTRGPGATLDLAAFVRNLQGSAEQFRVAGRTLELRAVPAPGADSGSGWPLVLFGSGLVISITLASLYQRSRHAVAQLREREVLEESETRYRSLFELFSLFMRHSPIYVYLKEVTPTESRTLHASENFQQMLGMAGRDIVGKTMAELFPAELAAQITADDWAVVTRGEVLHLDETLDGRHYTSIKFPIVQGDRTLLAGYTIDVTERKQAEIATQEARLEAERLAQLRQDFLATMSHEIRTPINGVIGSADLLARTPLDPHQRELLETILDSASNLRLVIDDILDFSKIEAGQLQLERESVSPQRVVEASCALLQPFAVQQGVRLRLFTDPDLPEGILSDSLRLRQILSNLLSNAIKFSGGPQRRGQVTVRAEPAGDSWLRLTVSDNGIGMTPEAQTKLFSPFIQAEISTTRRFGGTGLGLSIVHHLIALMAGRIEVESAPDQGATFRVTLPYETDTAAAVEPAGSVLTGLTCLVIAHDDAQARDWCRYLAHVGARAESVQERDTAARRLARCAPASRVVVLEAERAAALHWHRELAMDPPPALVIVEPGQRRLPRLLSVGIVQVDDAPLARDACVAAVGIAAGRLDPEVNIPRVETLTTDVAPPERAHAIEQGRLILVAEDNPVNQKVIRRQLALLGFAADLVETGREALMAWRHATYGLLLTDLHMPEMDGYDLALAIRAEEADGRHLPIIALSADVLRESVDRCRACGIDDYLAKPVLLGDLLVTLDKWLPPPVDSAALSVPPTAAVVLDERVLVQLIGDDPVLIAELLSDFRTSAERDAARMRAAVAVADWETVRAVAHGLKSASFSIGALPLGECCLGLEQAGKAGDGAAIVERMEMFDARSAAVLTEIENKRSHHA